ncbi:hypothetical protein DPMN_181592 [Dreissena polymorpha]|uniref:Uncharacterized protein n=1 Tax=Dreissena polymorpha TaxID=45954 RepID=A0A9D4DE10_DREPO|nr:hypothetical protein DPMN_181592 [Dreissena polymorpha]
MPHKESESKQPCLSPLLMGNGSEQGPVNKLPFMYLWKDTTMLRAFGGADLTPKALKSGFARSRRWRQLNLAITRRPLLSSEK